MSDEVIGRWDEFLVIKVEKVTGVCRLTRRVDVHGDVSVTWIYRTHDRRE